MKISVLFFFVLAIISCKNDNVWNEESNKVHVEVKNMLHNYYKDINEKGLIAELKYLDSSADFTWLPPGFEGPIPYDSAAAIIRNNAIVISSADLTWDSLTIIPIHRDTAKYTGRITSIVVDTSGYSDTLYLSEHGIAVRRKSGWKLLSGTTRLIENIK